jgi:type II secretory pathway component PulK
MNRAVKHRRRERRGFAATLAIAMIVVVAVAVAALTTRIGTAARIARGEREQAQVRQLLMAATDYARAKPQEGERAFAVPEAVASQGGLVKIVTKEGKTRIEARVGKSVIVQTIEADGSVRVE